ncbi:MAG: hypothetical protein II777_02300 [Clostridia bacterium]|nr:hypothetical protein [Clostridia bacterium]
MIKRIVIAMILVMFVCFSVSADYTMSDDMIKKHYYESAGVYAWFTHFDSVNISAFFAPGTNYPYELPFTAAEYSDSFEKNFSVETEEGLLDYMVIKYEEVNTYKKMNVFLQKYFEKSLVEKLLKKDEDGYFCGNRFIEKNGYIYELSADVGEDTVGSNEIIDVIIEEKSNKQFILTVQYSRDLISISSKKYTVTKDDKGNYIFENYNFYAYTAINPASGDSAVYITAGAGVIALCCAVICKKKIKER